MCGNECLQPHNIHSVECMCSYVPYLADEILGHYLNHFGVTGLEAYRQRMIENTRITVYYHGYSILGSTESTVCTLLQTIGIHMCFVGFYK